MKQLKSSSVFLFLISLYGFSEGSSLQPDPALLIVSYDGFRPEYFHRNVTPNLNKFRREGTSARFMKPVFPTKTFVNHFTIATVCFNAIKHIRICQIDINLYDLGFICWQAWSAREFGL